MGWSELSKIDLKSRENVRLYWRRWHPAVYTLGAATIVAVAIFGGLALVYSDPNSISYSGRGAWMIVLFLLLPIAARIIVIGILVGFLLESVFKHAVLTFGTLPAYVIGPDGIAYLSPWNPKALTWREIRKCTRHSSQDEWGNKRTRVLSFGEGDRRIAIRPFSVDMTEEDLIKVIERFAGRIVFDEDDVSTV